MRETIRSTWRRAGLAAVALACLTAACHHDGTGPEPPGGVSGAVRTQEGTGVEGVAVTLQPQGGAGTALSAQTGADGSFAFASVAAGSYTARAALPSGYDPAAPEVAVTVKGGATATVGFSVQAVRAARDTAAPGTIDTLTLASGLVASVAATAATGPLVLSASEVAAPQFGAFKPISTPVTLELNATAAAVSRSRSGAAAAAEPVTVTVMQRVATCAAASAEIAFEVGKGSDGSPIFLYTEPTCTTYTDPRTGRTGAAYAGTTSLLPGSRLNLALFAKDVQCSGDEKKLYAYPGTAADSSKTPVILIHGWQATWTHCSDFAAWEPGAATFGTLAEQVRAQLPGDYQLYVLRYPTMEPVANAVAFLRQQVVSRGWDKRDVVLVGHSMGGLVGRGYMAAYGSSGVRALVTLGTPHLGSPLAEDGGPQRSAIFKCLGGLGLAGKWLYPESAGYRDLSPAGAWIQSLRDQKGGADRTYSFAGTAADPPHVTLDASKCVLDELTGNTSDDGVVPVASAAPDWTTLQTVVSADHYDVTSAAAGPVMTVLRQLAQCVPGTVPAAPAANDFPLRGTLSRQPDGRIDVIVNPVVVDGTPVRGLTRDNFQVIEDNCLKPYDITTSAGNLGVDLVFVQDLSGSMSGAISGVRNSVLDFAAALRTRGLNVRIGSVGFSGPGTITTFANQSDCERVGPVQDLTAPDTFRTHVAATWYATGGCDTPENALEAVKYAHEHMTWRTGASRVYILITDTSIHTAADVCDGLGPCTGQTLESIVALLGSTATVHAIAPAGASSRTVSGGLDPWLIAARTGGAQLALPSGGYVDLNALGVTDRIADVVRLTFGSSSTDRAFHRIRVRVAYAGKVSEIAPGLLSYDVHPSLRRARP
jgi:pimeloyl-ACP methyl ester carboxylesterase